MSCGNLHGQRILRQYCCDEKPFYSSNISVNLISQIIFRFFNKYLLSVGRKIDDILGLSFYHKKQRPMKKILLVVTAAFTAVVLSCNPSKTTTTNSPGTSDSTNMNNNMNTDTSQMMNNNTDTSQHR
jgi:hypothetical protein